MKRVFTVLILISVPVLLMIQVLQAFRYTMAFELTEDYEKLQEDRLEENKRLLAGIAVFSAPERIYTVAEEDLGLDEADPDKILHVQFPNTVGGDR